MGQSTMFGIRAFNNTGSIKDTGEGISNTPNPFNLPMSEVQSALFPMLRQLYALPPAWTSTINVMQQIVKKKFDQSCAVNSRPLDRGFIGFNASGLGDARFRSDVAAIDMVSFPWRDEGEVSHRGLRSGGDRFRDDDDGRAGFVSSHQPSFRSRRGSRDLRN
jgi:hypothetical protein